MGSLRLVLGDQLSHRISSLRDIDRSQDVVLMVEARAEACHLPHHQQKIALVLSAMRHFADGLAAEGLGVDYVRLDDPRNTGSFKSEVRRALSRHSVDRIIVTEPGEWRVSADIRSWQEDLHLPVEIRADNRFLSTSQEFQRWAAGRRALRMESFYRHMRRRTGWLMDGLQPRGGRWNCDPQNRRPLPRRLEVPPPLRFAPDSVTNEVLSLVGNQFGDHFGELQGFGWAVTRRQALSALDDFVNHRLPSFGDYQDAVRAGQDWLFHSVLSPYLNIGLLEPTEVCLAALAALDSGDAPIHAVEGFVRQILGWREYARGIYWLHMPDYASTNFPSSTPADRCLRSIAPGIPSCVACGSASRPRAATRMPTIFSG